MNRSKNHTAQYMTFRPLGLHQVYVKCVACIQALYSHENSNFTVLRNLFSALGKYSSSILISISPSQSLTVCYSLMGCRTDTASTLVIRSLAPLMVVYCACGTTIIEASTKLIAAILGLSFYSGNWNTLVALL